MANLNIPANPSVGDTYEENGVIYTWTGTHWTASVTETYASGPLAGFRNMIINGNMIIAQRGEGPATNSGFVTADRWSFGSSVESTLVGLATGVDNNGTTNMLRVTSTDIVVSQAIEMPYVAGAPRSQLVTGEQYTISLLAMDATDAVSVNVRYADGSTGGNFVDVATDTGFVPMTADNLAGGLTRYTRTFTVGNNVPVASNKCILLSFNPTASSGTIVQFGNVQFEPGPFATPFEHRPFATELALCQRYYQKSYDLTSAPGANQSNGCRTAISNNAGVFNANVDFKVTMRIDPSIQLWDPTGGVSSLSVGDTVGQSGFFATQVGGATNSSARFHYAADAEL